MKDRLQPAKTYLLSRRDSLPLLTSPFWLSGLAACRPSSSAPERPNPTRLQPQSERLTPVKGIEAPKQPSIWREPHERFVSNPYIEILVYDSRITAQSNPKNIEATLDRLPPPIDFIGIFLLVPVPADQLKTPGNPTYQKLENEAQKYIDEKASLRRIANPRAIIAPISIEDTVNLAVRTMKKDGTFHILNLRKYLNEALSLLFYLALKNAILEHNKKPPVNDLSAEERAFVVRNPMFTFLGVGEGAFPALSDIPRNP